VLIFDEVSTGFRFGQGAVQPFVQVTPDMAVFAKSISNGYPMAAVVGRRDIMEPAARMFISSTYWSDTLGLRAALTTLRELQRRDVPAYLQQLGSELKRRINSAAAAADVPVRCAGLDVHPQLHFDVPDAAQKQQLVSLYIQEMARRGCHGYASFYLNAAQGSAELQQTEAAAREVFLLMRRALDDNTLDAALECSTSQDVFRRLVT
jgi:glutamate-1-semialdehyde 2,1-aminomutase